MADAPIFAWSAKVSTGARLLLVLLWRFARADRPTAWPSQRTLIDITGSHARTIQRQLSELREHGWIEACGETGDGVTIWRLAEGAPTDATPGIPVASGVSPGDHAVPPPAILSSTSLSGEAQVEAQPTTAGEEVEISTVTALALVPVESNEKIATKRRKAALVVWNAHEQRRVDRQIGRAAIGGGLRKPAPKDIAAIIRCATTLRDQENVQEGTAWRILKDAAIAAVDAAARAMESGTDPEFAKKLRDWRRDDPFGGNKLRAMLRELERSLKQKRVVSMLTPEQRAEWERSRKRAPDGWMYNDENKLVPISEAASE